MFRAIRKNKRRVLYSLTDYAKFTASAWTTAGRGL